jgi:16S rRNA (cytosine967-C5)-methyltransferase
MLDVPCSGSGVIRKNPETKWKFTNERLNELIRIQELILQDSVKFLKGQDSKIVYSTCSLFEEENLLQVIKFCDKFGFEIENHSHFQTLPRSRGMDGFFSATLVPKK